MLLDEQITEVLLPQNAYHINCSSHENEKTRHLTLIKLPEMVSQYSPVFASMNLVNTHCIVTYPCYPRFNTMIIKNAEKYILRC